MDTQLDQQLAPYLSNLNGADFCEEFEKFADLVLSSSSGCEQHDYDSSSSASNEPTNALSSWPPDGASSPAYHHQKRFYHSASSPIGASPGGDYSYYSNSTSGSYSSSCSPCPVSGTSSTCEYDSEASGKPTAASNKSGLRKRRNASAAERYRRKLKGHRSSLDQQLGREQERNERLRRQINSKLELYSEFVALLAQNTTCADVQLATLGRASLQQVLRNVLAHDSRLSTEQCALELARHLAHFERIQLQLGY